ncbi:MAG: hypothetical protein Kow00120_03850 [Anaerolineae bacterium]
MARRSRYLCDAWSRQSKALARASARADLRAQRQVYHITLNSASRGGGSAHCAAHWFDTKCASPCGALALQDRFGCGRATVASVVVDGAGEGGRRALVTVVVVLAVVPARALTALAVDQMACNLLRRWEPLQTERAAVIY